jgi:hypothetical protein
MNFILLAFAATQFYLLYRLSLQADNHNARIKALESRKWEGSKVVQVPEWQKPVENFNPQKPETLRPGQVRGREAYERVFEFDVKIEG